MMKSMLRESLLTSNFFVSLRVCEVCLFLFHRLLIDELFHWESGKISD